MNNIKYLNSFDEVEALVSEVRKRRIFNPGMMEHYRGQGRPEYKLNPHIARKLLEGESISKEEDRLLETFQKELKKKGLEKLLRVDPESGEKGNQWNILLQMQHLGIPTRFLDWTLKWEVGLWFAVENPKNDTVDGQFWIYSVPDEIHLTEHRDNFYKKDIKNLDKTYFINEAIHWSEELPEQMAEIKRQRQHGKFTVSPYHSSMIPLEEQAAIVPHLEKYGIPAKIKGQLRLELTCKGFHKDWLNYRELVIPELDEIIKKL